MVLVVLQTQIYAAAKSDIGTAKVNFDRAARSSFELGSKAGCVVEFGSVSKPALRGRTKSTSPSRGAAATAAVATAAALALPPQEVADPA